MIDIQAQHLTKAFRARGNRNLLTGLWRPDWKSKTAVNDVSFDIASGEAVAFLGPNGAGKTTTTKMMTGLVAPTSGQVRVLGYDPFERDPAFLRQIGLVMGNRAGLNWDLTARQSFWLNKSIYEIPQARYEVRVRELSTLLGVSDFLDTQVRRLSLGERMKLELIGAILHEPKVLFLDEPTIGLDVIAKKNIREFLRELHRGGQTLILTSHDMDDIEEVCERVVVVNEGHKVYDDSLRTLVARHKQDRYVRFIFKDRPAKSKLQEYGVILELTDDAVLLRVEAARMVRAVGEVSAAYEVLDMRVESVPLEQIISELFEQSQFIMS
jgi:ABC-2 type transport system ATP-binding protein